MMRPPSIPGWRGPPLALQIMALLIAGLVVAQLVTLLLTELLPPAPAPQFGLDDIAASLRRQDAAAEVGLQRIVQAGPPDVSGPGWLVSERSRQDLARLIGVDPARVGLAFYTPLPFAGTASARQLAAASFPSGYVPAAFVIRPSMRGGMADDGFVPPLSALSAAEDRPATLLRLAQFGAAGGAMGRMREARGMTPPPGGTFPPGSFGGRTILPGTASPLARGGGGDRDRPLVSSGGTTIPGDNGAAVPALLRGQVEQPAAQALAQSGAFAIDPRGTAPPPLLAPGGGPMSGRADLIQPDRAIRTPLPDAGPIIASSSAASVTPPPPPPAPVIRAPAAPSAEAVPPLLTPPPPLVRASPTPLMRSEAAPGMVAGLPYGPPITVTPTRRSLFGLAPAPFVQGDFVAALRLPDGRWAVVQPAPEPFPNSWQQRVLLWFVIALAVVVPFGLLFSRSLVRPIARFANAAEQLGRDPAAAIGPLDGPAEIGRAARAFNLMQNRLRAFVDDRTAMVSAISHDLRTPLTRMRFRIEDVADGEVRDGLLEEVDEMEAMITQVIEFIRDASAPAVRERLDFGALVDDVVEDARMIGGDVTIERAVSAPVEVDVLGMRRLLDNLLENAVKYGERARVRLRVDGEDAVAEIVDDGPGLPDDELERVFEPFYRSEEARSSDKAGSGLGLAVCRSIARAHGGDVRLRRAADGFRAEVRLPLAFGAEAAPGFAE